jgi:uroporphyrinogen-III decarboxylase
MNERERILSVLDGGKADTIPWFADLSWWYDAHKQKGDLPEIYCDEEGAVPSYQSHFQLAPTDSKGYLRLHQDTGVGIFFYAPMVWKERFNPDIKFRITKDGNRIITKAITPIGELESISQYLPESYTSAYQSYFVKQPEDLKVMQYIWKNRLISPHYEAFIQLDQLWGGSGIAIALSPISSSALQTLITRWAGIETTVNLLIDAETLLEETIEVVQSADDEIFEIIANSPARIVEFPDNVSGQVTGKNLLRKYVLPYWKKRINQLHSGGKYVGVHNDGGVSGALPVIIEAGFDFVEAITPKPVGDITLEEIKILSGGRIVVIGGLPGAFFSPLYSDDFFRNFVEKVLSVFSDSGGFILGSADQVPPDAEFDRICMVREILNNN